MTSVNQSWDLIQACLLQVPSHPLTPMVPKALAEADPWPYMGQHFLDTGAHWSVAVFKPLSCLADSVKAFTDNTLSRVIQLLGVL